MDGDLHGLYMSLLTTCYSLSKDRGAGN